MFKHTARCTFSIKPHFLARMANVRSTTFPGMWKMWKIYMTQSSMLLLLLLLTHSPPGWQWKSLEVKSIAGKLSSKSAKHSTWTSNLLLPLYLFKMGFQQQKNVWRKIVAWLLYDLLLEENFAPFFTTCMRFFRDFRLERQGGKRFYSVYSALGGKRWMVPFFGNVPFGRLFYSGRIWVILFKNIVQVSL